MFSKWLDERLRVVRDEKLTLGVDGMYRSAQSNNCNSNKEEILFISCNQLEAMLRFT